MSDAIIVPGRGVNQDGTLPVDPQSRVRKAVELYRHGRAPVIVMSGAWTYHSGVKPKRSESKAMKEYAIQLGVPESAIIEESKSMDTMGNVYFTKKEICEAHGFTSLSIVASDEHMPRIKYLFEKIYGPDYSLQFVESRRVIDDESYKKEKAHEASSMAVTRQWLDAIEPGDDAAVWRLMITKYPAYMPSDPRNTTVRDKSGTLYPDAP